VPALYDAPPYRVHRQVIPLFPQTMPVPRFSRGIFIFREIRRRGFSSAGETGKEKQTATAGCRHCMTPPLSGSPPGNPSLSADNAGAPFFAEHFYFPGNPAKRFFFSRRDRKRKTDGDSRVPALYDAPPYRVHRQVIPLFPQTMSVTRFSRGIFIFREIRRRGFSSAGETGKEKQTATAGCRHCMTPPPIGFTAR